MAARSKNYRALVRAAVLGLVPAGMLAPGCGGSASSEPAPASGSRRDEINKKQQNVFNNPEPPPKTSRKVR